MQWLHGQSLHDSKDYEIEKGKDFMQLILDKNITPPVRQVSQLPPSTKKTKPYSKAIKEPLKEPHKKETEHLKTVKTTKKYGLRGLNKKN